MGTDSGTGQHVNRGQLDMGVNGRNARTALHNALFQVVDQRVRFAQRQVGCDADMQMQRPVVINRLHPEFVNCDPDFRCTQFDRFAGVRRAFRGRARFDVNGDIIDAAARAGGGALRRQSR